MIKFYEIIIKEMLNLNRTKILQYLIDFMVKRKNSQLDLLNFNYLATTGPVVEKLSPTKRIQIPDSTQQAPSEKKPLNFLDTSYNFILRSDPIYIMACSKFTTNIRNVIRCRCSTCVQHHSFERRPFDNNILRNRRIGKRLVSEREEMMMKEHQQCHVMVPEKVRRFTEIKQSKFPIHMPLKIQNLSPILVESDTPPPSENSSPPVIQQPPIKLPLLEKPKILSQFYLHRAFSERIPITSTTTTASGFKIISPNEKKELPKIEFPKIMAETPPVEKQNLVIRQPAKRRPSTKTQDYESQLVENDNSVQHITVNELKTLTLNGTEIIPTSILRNTITSRRKTVDERLQLAKTSGATVEFRKVAPLPHISEPLKITPQSTHKALMKRRQSCHERIVAPSSSTLSNNSLESNYINFLKNNYGTKEMQQIRHIGHMQRMQLHHQAQLNQQQQQQALHANTKRVRFSNEREIPQQSRANIVQYPSHSTMQQHQQQQQYPGQQHPVQQRSPNFYQQQHQKFIFERNLRERGFCDGVETLNDRAQNQPTELVSTVTPERYVTSQQTNVISPKVTRVPAEKSPRMSQRTPVVTNDEKMKMVAFQQLQSLRDTSALGPQQYAEHLKHLHLTKQSINYQRPNSQEPRSPRESYFHNTQSEANAQQSSFQNTTATTTVTISTPSSNYPIISSTYDQNQSLQRKLQLKAKSSIYVEPNQLSKPFYNPPNSTYYSDPYAQTANKAVSVSQPTAFHTPLHQPPPQQSIQPSTQQPIQPSIQQQQLTRNLLEMRITPAQLQYHWMLQQQQQHAMHPNQPAR